MITMKALKAFESMDGSFQKDETFVVNEERALVLTRTNRAERAPAVPPVEAEPLIAPVESDGQFGVPRQHGAA